MIRKLLVTSLILLLLAGGCAGEEEIVNTTESSVIGWMLNTFTHGGISDDLNTLIQCLYNDTTNENEYVADVYDCTNYAVDLTDHLIDEYESGIVVRLPKDEGGIGHMLSWVRLNASLYVIEPQSDLIYDSDEFNATIDDAIFNVTYGPKELGQTEANTTKRL